MNRRELLKSTLAAGMGLAVGPLATMGGIVSSKKKTSNKIMLEIPEYGVNIAVKVPQRPKLKIKEIVTKQNHVLERATWEPLRVEIPVQSRMTSEPFGLDVEKQALNYLLNFILNGATKTNVYIHYYQNDKKVETWFLHNSFPKQISFLVNKKEIELDFFSDEVFLYNNPLPCLERNS